MSNTQKIALPQKDHLNHAEFRALKRYGVILTQELTELLLTKARIDPIKRVYRPTIQRYVCTVCVQKKTFRIVCNDTLTKIITFLPRKVKYAGNGD